MEGLCGPNHWCNDKQGFPMKQGVLTHGHVRLLLSKGHSCYRPRRTGESKHTSLQACIVDATWVIMIHIPGLTDTTMPHCLGTKRASRIHKLFHLLKEDYVHQYDVTKPLNKESKKPRSKAPKIQRLTLPRVLQHKHWRTAWKQCTKKSKEEAAEYTNLVANRMKEAKEKHQEQIAKRQRLSSLRASKSESSQK